MYVTLSGVAIMLFNDIMTIMWWPFLSVHSEAMQRTFSNPISYLRTVFACRRVRANVYREVTGFDIRTAVMVFCKQNFPHVKYGIVVYGDIESSVVKELTAFKDMTVFKGGNMFLIETKNLDDELALLDMLEKEAILNCICIV